MLVTFFSRNVMRRKIPEFKETDQFTDKISQKTEPFKY